MVYYCYLIDYHHNLTIYSLVILRDFLKKMSAGRDLYCHNYIYICP